MIQLSNGLTATLVSDPNVTRAGAAVNIGAGSFDEPSTLPGLAHLLEHMLFLGSVKYPTPSEYENYVSGHSGSWNGYTDDEHTMYYFDIDPPYLAGALDRLASVFVKPLLNSTAVPAEAVNVNSEYELDINNNDWRIYMLQKTQVNPAHPLSRFTIGNLQSLVTGPQNRSIDVHAALLAFFEQYYVSRNMWIVVVGQEPLDVLQSYVLSSFAGLRDDMLTSTDYWARHARRPPPFVLSGVPVVTAASMGNLWRVSVSLPLPPQLDELRQNRLGYATYLLGHEGAGSVLAYLQSLGWVDALSASSTALHDMSLITVEIGMNANWAVQNTILSTIGTLFEYTAHVMSASAGVFNEMVAIEQTTWLYGSKPGSAQYAQFMAERMRWLAGPEDLLNPPSRRVFNATQLTSETLCYLSKCANNITIVIAEGTANETQLSYIEPWFRINYGATLVTPALAQLVLSGSMSAAPFGALYMPPPNPYIPSNFTLVPIPAGSSSTPTRVDTGTGIDVPLRAWFEADPVFRLPHIDFRAVYLSPAPYRSASRYVMTQLYLTLVNMVLQQEVYIMNLAGYRTSITLVRNGIQASVSGFSDQAAAVISALVQRLSSPSFTPGQFGHARQQLLQAFQLALVQPAYYQAIYAERLLMLQQYWPFAELAAWTGNITMASLQQFVRAELFAGQTPVETLAAGNLDAATALNLARLVCSTLQCGGNASLPSPMWTFTNITAHGQPRQALQLANTNAQDMNSALSVLLPVSIYGISVRQEALLGLLDQQFSQQAFDMLRTQDQLGYVVFGGISAIAMSFSYRVLLQTQVPLSYAESRVDNFLAAVAGECAAMTSAAFGSAVATRIGTLQIPDLRLADTVSRNWLEILTRRYDFSRREQLIAALQLVQLADLCGFFNSLTGTRVVIDIYGAGVVYIEDPDAILNLAAYKNECVCAQVRCLNATGLCVAGGNQGPLVASSCPADWQYNC